MTEHRSTADRSFIKCAKSAACFFCALTVLLGAWHWFVYGIVDNLGYHKYTGKVIKISEYEYAPERNICIGSGPANIVYGQYEYFTKSGCRQQGSFTIIDESKEKYTVGSEYVVYTHNGRSGDVSEYSAKQTMRQNIIFPLILIIPALTAALTGAAKAGGFFGLLSVLITAREMFPKSFYFSLAASLLSGAVTVYTRFIFEDNSFVQIKATALCLIAIIAEIIVWAASIHREKNMIIGSEGESPENAVHTG